MLVGGELEPGGLRISRIMVRAIPAEHMAWTAERVDQRILAQGWEWAEDWAGEWMGRTRELVPMAGQAKGVKAWIQALVQEQQKQTMQWQVIYPQMAVPAAEEIIPVDLVRMERILWVILHDVSRAASVVSRTS